MEAHRPDVHRDRAARRRPGRRAPARSSRRRCRRPAPARAARDLRALIAPAKTSAASSSPRQHLRLDPEPTAYALGEDSLALRASRVAEVAQKRTRSAATPWSRMIAAYSSIAANVRSSASSASRPVRSTPCPSRTIRESRARPRRARRRRERADQQLDRCWSRSRWPRRSHSGLIRHRAGVRSTHGPGAHQSPSSVEHLVAERVDARPMRERLAGQHVEALDPVGHAAGGDALDLGHARAAARARPRRGPRGSARGPRGRPPPAPRRRRAAPASPSSAPSPRGCRCGRPRAGR